MGFIKYYKKKHFLHNTRAFTISELNKLMDHFQRIYNTLIIKGVNYQSRICSNPVFKFETLKIDRFISMHLNHEVTKPWLK